MTKIDIISGFLGAGKTTLIKKLLSEALSTEKIVLIENEFGEIGIDGGFLKEAGVQVTEMNSGCICCSLVGDFGEALGQVLEQYHPDRVLIEPSGVGKLSDVIRAVEGVAADHPIVLNSFVTVVDAGKIKMYLRNFGEFYLNQIENSCAIILSRTASLPQAKLDAAVAMLREHNEKAHIVTTSWDALTGAQLLDAMENSHSLADEMRAELAHAQHHAHDCDCGHDHHHEHDHDCDCGHDHHEHDHECGCGHDHHEHDHDCDCGHDHHEHDHDCDCGHDHHEHDHDCGCGHDHHHHAADDIFTAWGRETPRQFTEQELSFALDALDSASYGTVLRAKGILPCTDGTWLHFDYVPGEPEIRRGSADYTGRLCVIGADLAEPQLAELFGIE